MKSLALSILTVLFSLPTLAAPSPRTAHLEKAVQLATLRLKGGDVCATEAFEPAILAELTRYSTNPATLQTVVKENPALGKALAQNFSFKRLLAGFGYSSLPSAELSKLIVGTRFESHIGGVVGPGAALVFAAGGELEQTTLVNGKSVVTKGKYVVEGLRLLIDVGGKKKIFSLTQPEEGREDLLTPVRGADENEIYSSSPWECEA